MILFLLSLHIRPVLHGYYVACVPVAVIVEATRLFQYTRQLHATRPHIFDICLGALVAILEGTFFFRFAPKNLVITIRVERRVDINKVDTIVGKPPKLVQIVSTVDYLRIDECAFHAQ